MSQSTGLQRHLQRFWGGGNHGRGESIDAKRQRKGTGGPTHCRGHMGWSRLEGCAVIKVLLPPQSLVHESDYCLYLGDCTSFTSSLLSREEGELSELLRSPPRKMKKIISVWLLPKLLIQDFTHFCIERLFKAWTVGSCISSWTAQWANLAVFIILTKTLITTWSVMTPRNLDELMSIWAIGGRRDDASITASKPVEVETTQCNYFSCSLSQLQWQYPNLWATCLRCEIL